MLRSLSTVAALLLLGLCIQAQDLPPSFPKAPVGFDDGKAALLESLSDSRLDPSDLVERLFEDASIDEVCAFVLTHLLSDEIQALDTLLDCKGNLAKAEDLAALRKLLEGRKLRAQSVVTALGKMLDKRDLTPSQTAAWLYVRNFNARFIASALDRQSNGSRDLLADLAALSAKNKGADELFQRAFWEFDLRDSTRMAGGHYDLAQLVESLLELGVDSGVWAKAQNLGQAKDLSAEQRTLIAWGDAVLLAAKLDGRTSERDLVEAALDHFRRLARQGQGSETVLAAAVRRATLSTRWLRTGGAGVVGVYEGPWGGASPPTQSALELGSATGDEFAQGLNEAIKAHFGRGGRRMRMVLYDDGSARAMLSLETPLVYAADTPLGRGQSNWVLFEGRASAQGKSALLSLVFAGNNRPAVTEFELTGLALTSNGVFLAATVERAGAKPEELLLRRVGRNCPAR